MQKANSYSLPLPKLFQYGQWADLIFEWSKSLGLNTKSNPYNQVIKLYEELGETFKAIQTNNKVEIMDGLGDIAVVCCVAVSQVCDEYVNNNDVFLHDLTQYVNDTDTTISYSNDTARINFALTDELNKFINRAITRYNHINLTGKCEQLSMQYIARSLVKPFTILSKIAEQYDCELMQCLNMAYTTIHFRSGEIKDGIFVKVEPTAKIIVPLYKLLEPTADIIQYIKEYAEKENIKYFKVCFSETGFIKHTGV